CETSGTSSCRLCLSEDLLLQLIFAQLAQFIARICTGCLGSGSVDVRIAALSGVKIVEAESLEEGTRHLAIEFVITLAEARERAPGMMRKLPQFITRLFGILMKMLLDIEDEAAWHTPENEDEAAGESSNYSVYCVRSSPTNAIGQLATDLGPDLQLQFHQRVLPALAGAMDDFHNPRVQPRTIEIEETLVEAATKGLHDRLPSPLQRLRWLSENLVEVTGTTESVSSLRIKVRAYCPVGKSEKGKLASSISVKSIELYTKYSSMPYTLPKLDMAAVPDFSGGAMENYGLITYREAELLHDDLHSAAANTQRPYADEPWNIGLVTYIQSLSNMTTQSDKLGLQFHWVSIHAMGFNSVASTNGKMDRMLQIYFIEIIVRLRKGRRWWLRIMDLFLRRLSLATTTVCEEFSGVPDHSPESFVTALIAKTSPEAFTEVGGGKRACLGRIDGGIKITGCSGSEGLSRGPRVSGLRLMLRLLTQVCVSRDAFPSLVLPLVSLSLPLVSLSFQPRTYNLATLLSEIVQRSGSGGECGGGCEDKSVCAWEDKILSAFMMACVAPRSHGGDAGGSPPRRPNRPVPAQCQSSMLRLETGNASLRKAFRENNKQPLQLGFDYADLGTFHPLGNFASMLNSLMGETVRPLPLACEWEEIPEAFKAHIYPTLESYFNLAEWYNNQDKVVVGNEAQRIIRRRRECGETEPKMSGMSWLTGGPIRIGCRGSLQNAANQAKNTIKVEKGHYEDLIETWRKGHSSKKTGEFKTEQNKQRYLDMKAMQEMIKAGIIPFKTDQEILDEVVPSDNRQNMSGMGRKLPGGGSTSRRRANRAYEDVMTRDQMTQILRQQEQEKELYRKQAEEAQARAYLASLKADAADQRANVAYQNTESIYGALVASTNGKMDCMLQIYFIQIIVRLRKGRRWLLRIMDLFLRRLSLTTTTVCEEFSGVPHQSPESFVTALIAKTSPEAFTQLPRMGARERGGRRKKSVGRIDGGCKITGCSGRVKDYVMECIGREIKQRPKSEWITADASSSAVHESEKKKSKSGWIGGCRSMRKRIKKMMRCMSIIERRGVGARAGVVEVVLIDGWMDLVVSFGGGDTIVMILIPVVGIFRKSVMFIAMGFYRYGQGTSFSLYYSGTFMPALQPSMKEIVAMLSRDLELPPLLVEYSHLPPSRFRSHRKARLVS
ncbi:Myc-type, basic helix-loop-helix domain-containing protein, partial [Tanacetum coccineum]